jgi:hypothetical protein
MFKLDFEPTPHLVHHQCTGTRQGEWITYRCAQCDYEMHENWRTGEMQIRNAKRDIRHSGSYFPMEYKSAYEDLN